MIYINYIFLRSLVYCWFLTLLLLVLYLSRWNGLKRDRLKALGLTAGSAGRLTDGRRIYRQMDELMVDPLTKDSRTESDRLIIGGGLKAR
jgi:hypothetical protein